MISPTGMAMATLTVMLWILWSDSFRKRPHPILYVVRIALFLIVSGVLVMTMLRQPAQFGGGARALVIAAALVGVGGAAYFARRLTRRT
jgi:hypothetical protein